MQRALDADEYLVEVPGIPRVGSPPTQPLGELSTELMAPVPDALASDHHAAFGQDQLDITQTEADHMIEPHRVAEISAGNGWRG